MTKETLSPISSILRNSGKEVFDNWLDIQLNDENRPSGVSDNAIKSSATEFFKLFEAAAKHGNLEDQTTREWDAVRQMLGEFSASRALQGSSPTETASIIFSLKQPLFDKLNKEFGHSNGELARSTFEISGLLDKLGLYTTEVFQRSREAIIRRQQKDMLEMSTPVIKLWDGVLAVPLIGTLDSARTQIVMESLLQQIVDTGSKIAILDITGVPTVDTQTAQHLMKTVSATRLMGADCIISGIRPQIAQTIVHLGIDIYDITTRATMADALREALFRIGYEVRKSSDVSTNKEFSRS